MISHRVERYVPVIMRIHISFFELFIESISLFGFLSEIDTRNSVCTHVRIRAARTGVISETSLRGITVSLT